MRLAQLLTIVAVCLALCHPAVAGEEQTEPALTIVLDHAKLTKWVLEDFPDGLPFDKTGKPTDDEKAKQFWELIAETPMTFKARDVTPGGAVHMICGVAGVPLYLTHSAAVKLKAADAEKQAVELSDSIENVVASIARLAGVDRTIVDPTGFILATADDPDRITRVISIPPRPVFIWRGDFIALASEAFPDGLNPKEASDEEKTKMVQIATSVRCDLVLPGRGKLKPFLLWIAERSGQPIKVDKDAVRRVLDSDLSVGPVNARFAPFLDALNAALGPAGFVVTAAGTEFEISLAEAAEEATEEAEENDGP